MITIAAVDENWGIGKDGHLLISIPEDMKFFRETTTGGTVIMGRKTLESFPGGRPLKDRVNVVLTQNADYEKEGVVVVHSPEELSAVLDGMKNIGQANEDEIFVIGGASVYAQLLDLCDTVYLTRIYKTFDADAFFPDLDKNENWFLCLDHEKQTYETKDGENIEFKFQVYCKRM